MRRRRSTRGSLRSFDPHRIANRETDAWLAYYRRRWVGVLVGAFGMVHAGFALTPWGTARGAFLVLRANQQWAPVPDNDPDAARRSMTSFYRLVQDQQPDSLSSGFDPVEAARLEVEWWRLHRLHQRGGDGHPEDRAAVRDDLVAAVADLYAYVYDVPAASVQPAAMHRVAAMDLSDDWVAAGCDPASPLVAEERASLVRSYAALLAAVHRP